jgi:hypothetical protein
MNQLFLIQSLQLDNTIFIDVGRFLAFQISKNEITNMMTHFIKMER